MENIIPQMEAIYSSFTPLEKTIVIKGIGSLFSVTNSTNRE